MQKYQIIKGLSRKEKITLSNDCWTKNSHILAHALIHPLKNHDGEQE